MKIVTTILLLMTATLATKAVEINVIGPCNETPVVLGNIQLSLENKSLGNITITFLNDTKTPYIGTNQGINSILNTPTGIDSIEVISDSKMRAYGWCFSLNGEIPDLMPDQIEVKSNSDKISWFYAYSTYDRGIWTDYCVPSYQIKAPQFCH